MPTTLHAPSDAPTALHRRLGVTPAWRRRLPRLSADEARMRAPRTALGVEALLPVARRWAEAVVGALGAPCEVSAPVLVPEAAPLAGAAFSVAPGPDLPPCEVRLDPELAAALVGAVTGSEAPARISRPDRVAAAILGHGLLLALGALEDGGLAAGRLAAAEAPPAAGVLEAAVRLGGRRGRLQVALPRAVLVRLLAALPAPGRRPLPRSLTGVLRPLELALGPVRLPASTLRALAPGDALCPHPLLRLAADGPAGPAFLSAGRGRAALGRLEPDGFHLGAFGAPTPTRLEPLPMPPDTDALEIDLRVVLAHLPTTLGELAALDPGAVLAVSEPDPRVRLMVGETVVAVGELVDVDGVLGVRVLARS